MKFMVNKTKAILSGCVLVFTGGFGIYYLVHRMMPEAPVFLAVAVIFGWLFTRYAASITLTDETVCRSFFGLFKKEVPWSDIRELGLIGENVFNKKKEKTGDKYIYFSPRAMTKEERFQMIVKWPPKDMLYMEYGERQLTQAMAIWGKDLKTYNVNDLYPDTENPKKPSIEEDKQPSGEKIEE